ncbi:hypothetical protein UPYG_G00255000 [Umbra pygmaea]|uniref:Tudor domain-containing protein n=1 Tax=Umbra pygmaea TaxID=75934 RepID=A0ABD0W8A4_UMBPY
MSSIPGLPTSGSNITVSITRVNLHPQCELVELWGRFDQDRKAEYQQMRKDIQFPRETFRELEGAPGDLCLVQVYETWYRARILSRNGSRYNVFLIDEGKMLGATTSMLSWGQKEFFHAPPEVELCVLSNVLPLSPENRWSPMALEFLKSLCGKTVGAFVQDVLVPNRMFILDIPCITRQMYEMGFAKQLSKEKFKLHVSQSLQSGASISLESMQRYSIRNNPLGMHEQVEMQQHYMYPELQPGTVETVIVTEVTNPLRVFCQLKVFSQELKKLTEQITQHYEGRIATGIARPQTLGSPCASRGSDGRWYRSVLQQIFLAKNVVEVLHVDYGKKQFVQVENIRPLATDFFRMPVVTYVCSLHGIIDKGVGWTASQIEYLKSLLLNRTMIAKFEYQCLSEGVLYVTLYGDENTNMNNLFGSKERCLLDSEKSHGNYVCNNTQSTSNPVGSTSHPVGSTSHPVGSQKNAPPCPGDSKDVQTKYPAENLLINSSYIAVVQHVENPSEFWIQTNKYADEFNQMMNDLADLYCNPVSAGIIECPHIGLYCAAKAQDGNFSRATVYEITGNQVKVCFVDYGNIEIIEWINLRVLPEKFKALPALAHKCSLANICPKKQKWSKYATDVFTKTIVDKILEVDITAKSHGTCIVQLTDLSAQDESDVGTLLCRAGFADKLDSTIPTPNSFPEPIIAPKTQNPHSIPYDMFKSHGGPQCSVTSSSSVIESRIAFKEYLFPIGSSFDVTVSYIESPNDFWCQLAQNSNQLKWLMQDIQKHYVDSKFGQPLEAACIARHPDNGLWHRALVIQKHATPYVNVLFIDYGWTKTISMQDLHPIDPKFMHLKGQAFRCSLYHRIHPASHSTEWTVDAITQFQDFVDNATTDHGVLKCTIYAVMYDSQKVVFNVVDLETPFQSVCDLMVQKGFARRVPAKKAPSSPFRLETYYYSTHNIKTGSEEEVIVTSVKSVNHFYCQLKRNADTVEGLSKSVNTLCRQLENTNCPQIFGTMCFAKYTDGEWYRAQIKSTKPSVLVNFVDYGDTLEVKKSDLLPIPIEANEIMSLPVQAVQCGLSDIPGEVPNEVNSWFETSMTDRNFRAVVIAKDPGGKLLVELYDEKMQVNAKIKGKFNLEMHREEQVVNNGRRPHDAPSSRPPALEASLWSKPKGVLQTEEDHQKCEKHPRVTYKTPHQKQAALRRPSERIGLESVETTKPPEKEIPQAETKGQNAPKQSPSEPQRRNVDLKANVDNLPKLIDLPSKSIKPGMVADVFVSHCNSPQSFFIQLIREEAEIFSLVDKLNDGQSTSASVHIKDLSQGDLVNAEFPEDYSWYRAVVREILGNEMALVEFVDFGNTATVSVSKMCRLNKHFLEIPRFSIPCFLHGTPTIDNEADLDSKVLVNFKENVGINGNKQLGCTFVKKCGSVWEVSLVDGSKEITCNASPSTLTNSSDVVPEISEDTNQVGEQLQQKPVERNVPPESSTLDNVETAHYIKPEISEGQTLEVYVSTVNGPHSFWCQSAESDKLDEITVVVGDAGNSVASTCMYTETLCAGSPCIALFQEDGQWYRAEVLKKDGDALAILFVDYGNESTVNLNDVRPVPTLLIDTPPQAFQCKLEGFDSSQGCWDDTALDQLSELVMDKLLNLTILRVSSEEEGGMTCFVKVKCKEEVINDTMKLYWKSSVDTGKIAENLSDPTVVAMSCDRPSLAGELQLAEENVAVPDLLSKEQNENIKEHDTDYDEAYNKTYVEFVNEENCIDNYPEENNKSVITNAAYHTEDDENLQHFQEDAYCLDYHVNSSSIVDVKMEEKLSKTTEVHIPRTVAQNQNSDVKAPNVTKEKSISTIICEGPSEELEFVSDSEDLSEAQAVISQVDNDKDSLISTVIRNNWEVDENESESVLERHFSLESAMSTFAVLEESATKDKELETLAEEVETEKDETGIRDEDEDHSKVFLLDNDIEMAMDPHSTLEISSEQEKDKLDLSDCFETGSNAGSEHDHQEQDVNDDSIALDEHMDATLEDLVMDLEPEMNLLSMQDQDYCFAADISACSEESSDVYKEQLVDIERATDVNVVSSAPTQEKDDDVLEEDVSCLGDVTSSPLEDCVDVYKEQLVDIERATDVNVVSSAPTQEKDDDVLEEHVSCLGDVTSSPLEDCVDVYKEHLVDIEQANDVEVVSSAPTQEKDDDVLEEDVSCLGDVTLSLLEDYVEFSDVDCSEDLSSSFKQKEDLLGESTLCPDKACSESTEQGAETQDVTNGKVTSSDPTQDDLLCSEEHCLAADECAEVEEATDMNSDSSTPKQDKVDDDVILEAEIFSPGKDTAETVMHLTLKVEENSDEDVIFVSETRPTQ